MDKQYYPQQMTLMKVKLPDKFAYGKLYKQSG